MPTVVELRKEAKRLGLRGYSKMKKAELEAAIEEALEDQSSNEEDEEHVPTDCISRSKMKLKPHQVQLVEHLKDHRGVVAAFGVGTGKTLTAVAAVQCYLDANPTHQVRAARSTHSEPLHELLGIKSKQQLKKERRKNWR